MYLARRRECMCYFLKGITREKKMIEAVNSVIANAQVLRSFAGQGGADSPQNAGEGEGISVPKAPYVSPYISVDLDYNKAVLQIRDSDTGDVLTQFPSEASLKARILQEARNLEGKTEVSPDNSASSTRQTSQTSQTLERGQAKDSDISGGQITTQINGGASSLAPSDILTVQDVTTSVAVSNSPHPQAAAAALTAQAGQVSAPAADAGTVSVLA